MMVFRAMRSWLLPTALLLAASGSTCTVHAVSMMGRTVSAASAAAASESVEAAPAAPASYKLLPNYNQALNVLVPHGVSKGGTVSYLGTFQDTQECATACAKHAEERCWSFVHMKTAANDTNKTTSWQLFPNTNNIFGRVGSPTEPDTGTIHHLGKFATLAECQHAVNASSVKLMSYTYHHLLAPVGSFAGHCYGDTSTTWIAPEHREPLVDSGTAPGFPIGGGSDPTLAGQCFAVTSPGFNPSYDTTAVSGIMEWGCRSDEDCSLNGKCSADSGHCSCRPAWKGPRCEQLNLLPPTRGAGYRGVDDGHNTSSWGGAVLKGSDGLYHMWAAEMTEHCASSRVHGALAAA